VDTILGTNFRSVSYPQFVVVAIENPLGPPCVDGHFETHASGTWKAKVIAFEYTNVIESELQPLLWNDTGDGTRVRSYSRISSNLGLWIPMIAHASPNVRTTCKLGRVLCPSNSNIRAIPKM